MLSNPNASNALQCLVVSKSDSEDTLVLDFRHKLYEKYRCHFFNH